MGMFLTNLFLKMEYQKIDFEDPYKNYISVSSEPYSVLNLSGSNGYPIEIVQKNTDDIKVLRSRLDHFNSTVKKDTLFIEFSGSNISMQESSLNTTPSGIIIHKNNLESIISTNTHNKVSDFRNGDLSLISRGKSYSILQNCNLNTLSISTENESQIKFLEYNRIDSLSLKMDNSSVVNLSDIDFKKIHPVLSDSTTLVLTKDTFKHLLKN